MTSPKRTRSSRLPIAPPKIPAMLSCPTQSSWRKRKKSGSEEYQRKQRGEPKKQQSEPITAGGQNSESRPRISDVRDAEEIRDDGNGLMQAHGLHDLELRRLVQENCGGAHQSQERIPRRPGHHRIASMHRSHR